MGANSKNQNSFAQRDKSVFAPHTISETIFQLQIEQMKHDEKYHRDIFMLPVHQRINHMALHFAKYTGRLVELESQENESELIKTLIDIYIISMVSANMFNTKISDHIQCSGCSSLAEASQKLAKLSGIRFDNSQRWLINNMAIHTGKLAKACESIDHIEGYAFREKIAEAVLEISKVALIALGKYDLDLVDAVHNRLKGVKERSIFHGIT